MRFNPVPLVDPARRFVLLTNAKCGGTTLKTWFFANLDLPGLARRPLRFVRLFGPDFAWRHLSYGRRVAAPGSGPGEVDRVRKLTGFYRRAYCESAISSGATRGHFQLAVVRHPADRAVSAFLDKFCGEDRDMPWVREAAAAMEGEPTFERFLDYVAATDDAAQNTHWRRQSYLLEAFRVDAFVRIERLEGDFAAVASRVGADRLGLLTQRLQRTAYGQATEAPSDFSRVPAAEIVAWSEANGGAPPKSAFLNERTRARIADVYARDFAALPYQP